MHDVHRAGKQATDAGDGYSMFESLNIYLLLFSDIASALRFSLTIVIDASHCLSFTDMGMVVNIMGDMLRSGCGTHRYSANGCCAHRLYQVPKVFAPGLLSVDTCACIHVLEILAILMRCRAHATKN